MQNKYFKLSSLAVMAMLAGMTTSTIANAATYEYVGSFHVGDGPRWDANDPVTFTYTGQEAAALLFGGAPGDYAISTVSNNPAEINFLAFLDGYGDEQYLYNPQPQDWKLDVGNDGYATPGGGASAYSAYVLDHTCGDRYTDINSTCPVSDPYINYVFRIISLTLKDVAASLQSTNRSMQSALTSTNLIVNGAHSRPLSRRVAEGEKTFWIAGDWGNDDHNTRDGSIGLAELSGGYNFGLAQINVSLGKTWANQNLIHNGDLDAKGKYLMLEGIIPLSADKGLYATLGAFHHWGDIDIDRNYMNALKLNRSSGSPDSRTLGVRARIDWENAFAFSTAQFSPYADVWHSKTKVDSYTETGGGFPAYFNSREDSVTELRAGVNAAMPIKQTGFDFIANLEAVRRFDNRAGSTSGQVIGLFAFNLEGEKYDQNWIKAGVGVEGMLGKGRASLMLNGTTEGEMPVSWLAASYQLIF